MADNEQYRGEVDGLLAKFGIPYRLLQMDASIGGGEIERRLSQWAQSNPNDPMAAQIQRNLPLVRDSLFQSVRGLRSGEDINPAVGRLRSALSGPQAQSGAQNININDGGQDVQAQDPNEVERQNLTMRMHMRRFTRLTNGFSKKFESHVNMVALYTVFYNFTKIHKTLRVTPAMAAGITDKLMTMEDIVALIDAAAEKPNRPKTYKKRSS